MKSNQRLKCILSLMKDFINRKIIGKEFEKKYIEIWENIRDNSLYYEDKIQDILDELFSDVDTFESDKTLLKHLREEMKKNGYTKKQIESRYTDEEGLREKVKIAYKKIKELEKQKNK